MGQFLYRVCCGVMLFGVVSAYAPPNYDGENPNNMMENPERAGVVAGAVVFAPGGRGLLNDALQEDPAQPAQRGGGYGALEARDLAAFLDGVDFDDAQAIQIEPVMVRNDG